MMCPFKLFFAIAALSTLLLSGTSAQSNLIDAITRNGSFELLSGAPHGSEKATDWDNDPDSGFDVDNWTWLSGVAPAIPDSGTEVNADASDGKRVAFIQPGTGVRNVTDHIFSVGETYSWSFDFTDRGRGSVIAGLGYWDGATFTTIASASNEWLDDDATTLLPSIPLTQNDSWVVTSGSWVGQQVGFYFEDVTTGAGTYPEVDNVVLTLVPEPSAFAAIVGVIVFGLAMVRRR